MLLAGVEDEVEALQGCQGENVLVVIVVLLRVLVAVLLDVGGAVQFSDT